VSTRSDQCIDVGKGFGIAPRHLRTFRTSTDRETGLLLDLQLDLVGRVDLEAAGVDDDEPPAVPVGVAVHPVACRPRPVLDDRLAAAHEAVE